MKYPILTRILAADNPTPTIKLREKPEVEANCWAYMDNGVSHFECDENSVHLVIPTITAQEYETLPKKFYLNANHYFEDEMGRSTTFYFKFLVEITGAEKFETTGEVDLSYNAELIEYEYD